MDNTDVLVVLEAGLYRGRESRGWVLDKLKLKPVKKEKGRARLEIEVLNNVQSRRGRDYAGAISHTASRTRSFTR